MVTNDEGAASAALSLVLVNTPPADADRIARGLVERRLAACVNVIPKVSSVYWWEGELTSDDESTLLIKTRSALVPALTRAVLELHPYSVPEVIALPLDVALGNPAYLAWVRAETEPEPAG